MQQKKKLSTTIAGFERKKQPSPQGNLPCSRDNSCGDTKTTENTVTAIVDLHADSKWKESSMSKLEVALDDCRNQSAASFADVGDFMEYGNKYEVTISVRIIKHKLT